VQSLMSWPAWSWQSRSKHRTDPLLERAIALPRKHGLPSISLSDRQVRRVAQRRLHRIALAHREKALPWRLIVLLLLSLSAGYGMWSGGQLERLYTQAHDGIGALAVAAGLGAETIVVQGQNHATDNEIAKALGVTGSTVLFTYDTDAAKARLERLPWVKHAEVMRLLPSTLQVVLEERTPYAIWQHKGLTYVVDKHGVVLAPAVPEAYPKLPIVVGVGAPAHAAALFKTLDRFPDLRQKLLGAIRVGDRRWNLKLASGLEIMLPDDNVGQALTDLMQLDKQRGLFSRNISIVDLRLADRITVRLDDEQNTESLAAKRPTEVPTATIKGNT
jgi:cell division protein FtsQ